MTPYLCKTDRCGLHTLPSNSSKHGVRSTQVSESCTILRPCIIQSQSSVLITIVAKLHLINALK